MPSAPSLRIPEAFLLLVAGLALDQHDPNHAGLHFPALDAAITAFQPGFDQALDWIT
jgi:hypothetical protein